MIRRFNRYELKYVMPWSQCEAVIEDLRHHARPDEHGGEEGYRIASLYYDSPDHAFFWAKVEGIKFRRKLRIRIYPGEDIRRVESGMVEIKQRINRTVQKRRIVLPLGEAERLCEGRFRPNGLDTFDREVVDEVTYLVKAKHLRPAAITAFRRRAFEGVRNEGFRVTFDTDLRARVHALAVNAAAENHPFAPPGWAIMEVKANDAVPDWMISLLGRHDCRLRRVSKYCAGLAQLKQIEVMSKLITVASPGDA